MITFTDHTHFKTKDGIVFTTRGYYHCKDKIRAIPLYRPSENNKVLKKCVDEFGNNWFSQLHSEWIQESPWGKGIYVPVSEISEIYDPFKSKEIIRGLKDETAIEILIFLNKIGITISNIGLLGSHLFYTGKEPHDVDFVIRGTDNLILIKNNFDKLLEDIQGQLLPSEDYVKKSIHRYDHKYNKSFNDFSGIIARRWPTICVPNKFFGKLRFTYRQEEVPECRFPQGDAIADVVLTGDVVWDLGTNFMPRYFYIKSKDRQIRILTYFWDFSYCVKTGDKVTVRGKYYPEDKTFLLSNPKQHGLKFNF